VLLTLALLATSAPTLVMARPLAPAAPAPAPLAAPIDADTRIVQTPTLDLRPVATYETGLFDSGAAEIVAHDPLSQTLYVTNAANNMIDVLDVSAPLTPTLLRSIDLATFGAGANSVAFDAGLGLLAAAIEADPPQAPGSVVLFDRDGTAVETFTVGALPDMLTFTPDGSKILVANEGEPGADPGSPVSPIIPADPPGSVSIIDVAAGTVATAGFEAFNGQEDTLRAAGVRIFPGRSAADDFEPEYIAVAPDGLTALVTLQENNALAVIDIAAEQVTDILPLGVKDHSQLGNGIDASDRDEVINIARYPVFGLYMPDGIAAFEAEGQTFYVTANEGDARDEDVRVADLALDPAIFSDTLASDELFGTLPLTDDARLGRLEVSSIDGDLDGDGVYEALYSYGARSFSVWSAEGELIFDSGDQFERIIADIYPDFFNSDHTENDSFDSRSDAKGPEPEGITTGEIDGRTYAFIGLERISGIMVYDVTDPRTPTFVRYVDNRDFFGDAEAGEAGDLGPEGLLFVDAADSPTGGPILVVANEVSGSTTIYEITSFDPDGAGRLSLLHNNDGESGLLPTTVTVTSTGTISAEVGTGGVAAFKTVVDREISDASALGNASLLVYAGDAFLASAILQCSFPIDSDLPVFDAVAQRQIPYTAHILGNHEFDYTPDFLERFIRAFETDGELTQPFLSANLDFSGEPGFDDLLVESGRITGTIEDGRVLAGTLIVTDKTTGQRFGIVGATTPDLPTISSPRNVTVITPTIDVVQGEIDFLESEGVTKIIFVSHLQDVENDRELVAALEGVDIAVAGGGDDFLVSPTISESLQLLPGQPASEIEGSYPLTVTDAAGRTVYIVTSVDRYRFLGRLDVVFDDAGEISEVVAEKSYPRRVVVASDATESLGIADAVAPDPALVQTVEQPVTACLADFATPIARTEILLDVSRSASRSRESNAGNLIADSFVDSYDRYAEPSGLPERSPSNPVVAIQNGGGIRQNAGDVLPRSGVVPGEITQLDTIDVLPFNNFISVVQDVTPADLLAVLDNRSSEGFYQIANLRLVYTETVENGQALFRIESITLLTESGETPLVQDGAVVQGAPNVSVVTNSFVAGREFAANTNQTSLVATPGGALILYEQPLREYLQTFPVQEGLPTIPADDPRYQPEGEGRIVLGDDGGGGDDGPALVYSRSPDRSAPQALAGTTISGTIYAFLDTETGIAEVEFRLNNPASPNRQREREAPFDFAGGSVTRARPLDTSTLGGGTQTIFALIRFSDGTSETVQASFELDNGILTDTLRVSTRPDRAGARELEGATVGGDIYVFLSSGEAVRSVAFRLDNPQGPVRQTEREAPFDFAGGGVTLARPFDTRGLSAGQHRIFATLTLASGEERSVSATFEVDQEGAGGSSSLVRFAQFNASVNRGTAGQLLSDLSTPSNQQLRNVAEIIQRSQPDVLLINEFDFYENFAATRLFQQNYLSVAQNGAAPIQYPFVYVAPSNTGVASGFDLNNNGTVVTTTGTPGYGDDAFGFGNFPGQFGMALFSKYPIDRANVRTFQNFLWKDMPGALLPDDPATPAPDDWYSPEELDVFRLSSKSHWDVPIRVGGRTLHVLASHPTPPVFDGPEDRNGRRNHDEIRFWADYIRPGEGAYIYDDQGGQGGLVSGASFVIMGDQNADPNDGDSVDFAIRQLLEAPQVNTTQTPSSPGGTQQAALQGGANATHLSDPAFDTADFADTAPGNLRADYVLPSADLRIAEARVFWPLNDDPLFRLVGTFNSALPGGFPSSDHRLVWLDVEVGRAR
jgi:2',3'-cyclic-nucleotide 2'-phosphodiesterase (5'-nucleotidase family)